MRRIVEISDLPELNSGFQRDYIDEFLMNASRNIDYYIDGDKVLNAYYGHVSNYPKGFMVLNPYASDVNVEEEITDPFPVISANFKRVSVKEIEDRLNEDTAYVDTQFKIDDYYSYCGWRLFLFQKIEESMDSLRFFSEHTRDL